MRKSGIGCAMKVCRPVAVDQRGLPIEHTPTQRNRRKCLTTITTPRFVRYLEVDLKYLPYHFVEKLNLAKT